jgi:hypothetical protein
VGSSPALLITKKGALDSQPHVIKLTSCLPMVGGFFPGTAASSTTKTGRHDIAEILLKLALKHQTSINQSNLTVCLLDMICKYIVYHILAE